MMQKEITELHKAKPGTSNSTPWGKDEEADTAKTGPTIAEEARRSPALQDGGVRKLSLRNLTRPIRHEGRATTDEVRMATSANKITSELPVHADGSANQGKDPSKGATC